MQGGSNLGEDFGTAVLLARGLAEPRGFQQAAQLPGQDGGLGSKVFIKKSFIGIMQKRCRADNFIEDHQRSSHEGVGFKLPRGGESRGRLYLVDEDRPASTDGFGGNGALLGKKTKADETLGQLAVGLLSDEFVAGVAPPEIDAADLEKFASGAAEELDQSVGIGALRCLGSDPQKKFLKGIVGVG